MTEEVTEAPTEEQEAPVREQVRVDHPGERRLREAEVLADGGKGNSDDRDVEDDHQARQTKDVERKPARPAVGGLTHAFLLGFRDHVPLDQTRPRNSSVGSER
jgi:hypothetical protein